MRSRAAVVIASLVLCACGGEPRPYRVDGDAIAAPLAVRGVPVAGDAAEGKRVFSERESGHCVLCHAVRGLDVPFQGDLGPPLTGIGERLSAGQIRLRIVDASLLNPETIMPPYYRTDRLHRVADAYRGKTALSAEQVEHLVAWLSSLGEAVPDAG